MVTSVHMDSESLLDSGPLSSNLQVLQENENHISFLLKMDAVLLFVLPKLALQIKLNLIAKKKKLSIITSA